MSDVMLLGVLRMPIPENPDPMTLRQFVSRARQAADRIEADGAEIERLRANLAAERERCAEIAAPERIPYSDDEWRVRCEVRDAILGA